MYFFSFAYGTFAGYRVEMGMDGIVSLFIFFYKLFDSHYKGFLCKLLKMRIRKM